MKMKSLIILAGIAPLYAATSEAVSAATAEKKAPKFAKKEYDLDTKVLSVIFGNDTTLELDVSELSPEIQTQLMMHGAAQKVGDSFAGAKGNFNVGIESAKDVIEQLRAGEWRGGGDEARPRLAELAAAIARIRGLNDEAGLAKVTAAVEAATDDQRKAWRSNGQVKAMIAQQRAEKAAKALEGVAPEEIQINLG